MKNKIQSLAICGSILACATASYANVTITTTAVGASTDFAATSLSTVNGTLSYSDILATPAGATIAGGQAQGAFASPVTAWGEVFKWAGSANGNLLTAFSMVVNGSGGALQFQPFLLDLGATTFNANGSTFNPSAQPNLLGTYTLQPSAIASQKFMEFDLSGSDAITLTVGHSYAFGFLDLNTDDINFQRDSGVQADPNGAPFQIGAGGLSATTATVPGFGGGPRNMDFALYTQPVPEPTSLALLASAAGIFMYRRAKKS